MMAAESNHKTIFWRTPNATKLFFHHLTSEHLRRLTVLADLARKYCGLHQKQLSIPFDRFVGKQGGNKEIGVEKEVEAADCLRTFDSENIPCDVYTRLIRQSAKCILSATTKWSMSI